MNSFRIHTTLCLFLAASLLGGCAGPPGKSSVHAGKSQGGGYYLDDGPGSSLPSDVDRIPNATPRIEQHSSANFKPYTAFGKQYVPVNDNSAYREVGTASWYGRKFHGKKTANGETYDMYAMTAAHPTLPLPSYAKVTSASTGKSVIVRINDRGPFHSSRVIDLSYVAASKLGLIGPGSGKVVVEAITNDEIRDGNVGPQTAPDLPQAEPRLLASQAPVAQPKPSLTMHTVRRDGSRTAPRPVPDALAALTLPSERDNRADDSPALTEVTGAAGHVYLQFGAFGAPATANALAQKLNTQIADVESRTAKVQPAGDLYRVRIGPYVSRTEAVNAASRIARETGMNATMAMR